MDNVTLKKKLSAYVSDKGYLKNVSEDVLYEVLVAWENWTGSSKEFYRSLGFTHSQMASVIGKAKKLRREGHFGEGEFKPVNVESLQDDPISTTHGLAIEIIWGNGRVIRFSQVDQLVDFLKKSA
jgi:hypothetical protein